MMSQESARSFLERMARDQSFTKCLERVDSGETLMEMVKYTGYDFTREELKHAIVALSNLSETELARVSGGIANTEREIIRHLSELVEMMKP